MIYYYNNFPVTETAFSKTIALKIVNFEMLMKKKHVIETIQTEFWMNILNCLQKPGEQ